MSFDNIEQVEYDPSAEYVKGNKMESDELVPADTPMDTTQAQTDDKQTSVSFYNLFQADQEVLKYYGRAKIQIDHQFPMQIVDGSVVEFIDNDFKIAIAVGRMRSGNQLMVDKATGSMSIPFYISNLSFKKSSLVTDVRQ